MVAGWATPTESAAIGALATMLLALLYRALSWPKLLLALRGTAGISGMILFIIIGATTFSQILSFSGASNGLVQLITGQGWSASMVLAGMMLLLIFLGIFVDQVSMMLITLPIFMPLVQRLGIDPVWFGVMFLICMQLGLLLPPHGLLLLLHLPSLRRLVRLLPLVPLPGLPHARPSPRRLLRRTCPSFRACKPRLRLMSLVTLKPPSVHRKNASARRTN